MIYMKCDNQGLNYNCVVKMWELKTAIFGIDETNKCEYINFEECCPYYANLKEKRVNEYVKVGDNKCILIKKHY